MIELEQIALVDDGAGHRGGAGRVETRVARAIRIVEVVVAPAPIRRATIEATVGAHDAVPIV